MDRSGGYYTWSNKHVKGVIYSRIDRFLGNVEWYQDHLDTTVNILPPIVSDRALLWLRNQEKYQVKKKHFKLINCVVDMKGYAYKEKLKRLQSVLRKLSEPLLNVYQSILKVRSDLKKAQYELMNDRMNNSKIEEAKKHTKEFVKWNELEENALRKKTKIVKCGSNIIHIDVAAMREGDQLSMEKRQSLIVPVSEHDILLALNGISNMKAPRIDGYGDRFFKESWQTIKGDVNAIAMDFFKNERLYKAFNSMVVTLIPKSEEAASIKDLNPIVGYTTL
ncbi:hypothetical protein KIW84_043485 [Lathyrus oleraceus]|uniref:Uncharacterized protein n=1 Tax=Pisum sativum TaxID=3888 RepID=A0A9D4XDU4_PEA|nr:hypothetical protein KIW84_043485 [Pisum sativum]